MSGFEETYEGDFLKSADLMDREFELEIAGAVKPKTEKDATGKVIDKGILSFTKAKKRLILTKTMYNVIKMLHGAPGESGDKWVGKKITIGVRYGDYPERFGGKNCPGIRVIPPPEMPLPPAIKKWLGRKSPLPEKPEAA